MKIKSIITALLGIMVIAAMLLFTTDTHKKQSNNLEVYSQNQLQHATEQIALKLSMYSASNLEVLEALTHTIAQYESTEWGSDKLNQVLKHIANDLSFQEFNICDLNGIAFDLEGKEQKVNFCSYYQRAKLGDSTTVYSNFYENSSNLLVVYTMPIHKDNQIIGVLRAALNPEQIKNNISTNAFRGKEDIYLLQKNGSILEQLSDQISETNNFMDFLDSKEATYSEIEQVMKQGRTIFKELRINNTNSYLSFVGVKEVKDWGIMITIPKDQLLALYEKEFQKTNMTDLIIITSALLSTLFLVLLAFMESRKRVRMERLAYYDEVTNSISFHRFQKEAKAILLKSSPSNYALIQIGIDKFDYIKDFFGIGEANSILLYISKILHENMKSDEVYCRINTDYFIVLLNYHNNEELTNRIMFMNEKIGTYEEKDSQNNKYEVSVHYGIYCLKEEDTELILMINKANRALLMVKNDKKQPFEFYSGEMQNRITDEKEIEEHMYAALDEKEFLVYLQPKFDLNSGKQVGAEALVRWMHPTKGLIYPGRFIGIFEKNGFIVKLDMYILDVLCHRLKVWISKGYRPMPLSINISRLNLYDDYFIDNVIDTLERYGIPSNLIQLEIAEEVVSDNIERLSMLMERLKKYGFLISMDDFGTGTTSMNTLYQVPVDELKLDRKFLLGAEKTERGKNVIKSIIEMAKRLDIKVVSEGVENKLQAKMLQGLGCDMIQGYVFCDPLPIKEYEIYAYGPRANENKVW